jgi:hypothetical protein
MIYPIDQKTKERLKSKDLVLWVDKEIEGYSDVDGI